MKLMSSVQFSDYLNESPYLNNTRWELHRKHVDFLKQKLRTNMFVVLNEDNDPMENPDIYSEESEELDEYRKKYLKQSESVLFLGFKLSSIGMMHVKNKNIFIGIGFENGIFQTVEDLVNHSNWPKNEEIELTATAQKQIGL